MEGFCGATAQEETLRLCSAFYPTLFGNPMTDCHRKEDPAALSEWTILAPNVAVFRDGAGTEHGKPCLLSFLTCAPPTSCG